MLELRRIGVLLGLWFLAVYQRLKKHDFWPISCVNDRAISSRTRDHILATENVRSFRVVLNALGDGFVKAIDDMTLLVIADKQPGHESSGQIRER